MLCRLESMAAQLQAACTDLGQPTTSLSPSRAHQDQKLLDLSRNVFQTAQTLQSEITKLSVQGPPSRRKALRKTVKIMWRKGIIDDIQRKPEHYQAVLNTVILKELRLAVPLFYIYSCKLQRILCHSIRLFVCYLF